MLDNQIDEYTYKVGNITFIVRPVYKAEHGETLADILKKLMKSDADKNPCLHK